jgi:N-acetylneuraminic acid mutarotase
MAPMLTARGEFGVAVVNGKIFAIGGLNGDGFPLSITEEYNPQTNQWTSKAPMPTPRSGFAIAVYLGKIYVIGGSVGNGFVGNNEVYNPVSDTWEPKTSMPTPRADLCANIVNDKIFLIGGKKYSSASPFFNETNLNEVYDPANDSWTTKTPIPTPISGYASAVADGEIYIMGGAVRSVSLGNALSTSANQVYNSQTENWSLATQLPYVNSYGAAASTEGFLAPARIYCIGGYYGGEITSRSIAYNTENKSWTTEDPMPTPRAYLGIAEVNDVLYCIGGFDGAKWLNVNEQYKPVGYGTVPPKVRITSPENKTYAEVSLAFTVNRGTEWMGYSLDNHLNITILSETKLSGLSQGAHNVTIYANDSLGNMGSSNIVFFSIDTLPPTISILLPKNQSYDSTDILLTFSVNENASYLAYSLDGQEKHEIAGNVTLPALTNGPHSITLYATDQLGNSAEKTVSFNIAPFPVVTLAAAIAITTIVLAAGYLFIKRKKPGSGTATSP